MTYYSTDGTFMRLEIPNGQNVRNPNTWTLFMADGSKVTKGEIDGQGNLVPQRVYDRNGNYITKGGVTLPDSTIAPAYVDQFGRYIAKKTISQTEDRIIKSGVDGQPIEWIVRWKYITVIKKYTTSTANDGIGRCCYSSQVLTSQPKVVDEIELPPELGGQKFVFNYNGHEGQVAWNGSVQSPNSSPGWGDLVSITLPSGAETEYDYAPLIAFDTDDLIVLLGKVKEKRLKYDSVYDSSPQQTTETWQYSISQSGTTTVVGPDGGTTTQKFYSTATDNDLSGRVYKETNSNGMIVERIWKNNQVGGCPTYGCGSMRRLNTYVKTEFMTIPDSAGNPTMTAIKDFDYDKNGNVIKVSEYDWVPYSSIPHAQTGPPLVTGIPSGLAPTRITENTYYNQTENASILVTNNPASYWNTTAPNVRSAIKSTTIKNASGTLVSYQEFNYFDVITTANLIETRVWDSTKGVLASPDSNGFRLNSGNSISTLAEYDTYGNVTETTDAKGVQTQIVYGDIVGPSGAVYGLYPTQTVAAYGTAIARTSTAEYDFHTGLVTSATDVDN
ncbi:MAG: hypothetical protein ACRD6X_18055, partial [Pyrinomonadaceae bacterium]